jgi:hypothetical protein
MICAPIRAAVEVTALLAPLLLATALSLGALAKVADCERSREQPSLPQGDRPLTIGHFDHLTFAGSPFT